MSTVSVNGNPIYLAQLERDVEEVDGTELARRIAEEGASQENGTLAWAKRIISVVKSIKRPDKVYDNLVVGELEKVAESKLVELAEKVMQRDDVLRAFNAQKEKAVRRKELSSQLNRLNGEVLIREKALASGEKVREAEIQRRKRCEEGIRRIDALFLQHPLSKMQSDRQKLRHTIAELARAIASIQGRNDVRENRLRKNMERMVQNLNEVNALIATHGQMTQQRSYIEAQLVDASQSLLETSRSIANNEQRLRQLQSEIRTVQAQLDAL